MKEIIVDTFTDSIKLLPFLFVAFLVIEVIEHNFSEKSKNKLARTKRLGPVFGSLFGIVPQCGFSALATNLYSTRIVTLGTLIAVYLSTSDEMLPILIAEHAPFSLIIKILVIKFIIGIVSGVLIDLIIKNKDKENYHICEEEHCHCDDEKLFVSALKHTFNIFVFIVICTFIIGFIMEFGGNDFLGKLLLKNNVFAPFLTSLIGLIPNCASSVILTELYLKEALSFSSLIAGLLSSAGVGLLVLVKTNKNKKEVASIIFTLYLIGALFGMILQLFF